MTDHHLADLYHRPTLDRAIRSPAAVQRRSSPPFTLVFIDDAGVELPIEVSLGHSVMEKSMSTLLGSIVSARHR